MKKLICILLLVTAAQAKATDYEYPYLVLTTGSGSKVALAVDGLEMTFENGKLVAKTATGMLIFGQYFMVLEPPLLRCGLTINAMASRQLQG